MAIENVTLEFNNEFSGKMTVPSGEVLVGGKDEEIRPYNLLFGALGSCFYATFLGIAMKKRLTFDRATVEVSGSKREELPTTLDHVVMKFTVKNPSNKEQIRKSALLGAEYCSIHETISKVAKIDLIVEFEI